MDSTQVKKSPVLTFNDLSEEVTIEIFKYLKPIERVAVERTCRSMKRCSDHWFKKEKIIPDDEDIETEDGEGSYVKMIKRCPNLIKLDASRFTFDGDTHKEVCVSQVLMGGDVATSCKIITSFHAEEYPFILLGYLQVMGKSNQIEDLKIKIKQEDFFNWKQGVMMLLKIVEENLLHLKKMKFVTELLNGEEYELEGPERVFFVCHLRRINCKNLIELTCDHYDCFDVRDNQILESLECECSDPDFIQVIAKRHPLLKTLWCDVNMTEAGFIGLNDLNLNELVFLNFSEYFDDMKEVDSMHDKLKKLKELFTEWIVKKGNLLTSLCIIFLDFGLMDFWTLFSKSCPNIECLMLYYCNDFFENPQKVWSALKTFKKLKIIKFRVRNSSDDHNLNRIRPAQINDLKASLPQLECFEAYNRCDNRELKWI